MIKITAKSIVKAGAREEPSPPPGNWWKTAVRKPATFLHCMRTLMTLIS
ncbi:MAG: hypothetical protein ACLT8E_04440 [Akkermansia sp.]